MKYLFTLFLFGSVSVFAQTHEVLIIGNYAPICIPSDSIVRFHYSQNMPDSIQKYDGIMLFSGVVSQLKSVDIDSIIAFASGGKGVYCGAENQPFQEEFNQLSSRLFAQEAWGNFTTVEATLSEKSIIQNAESKKIYAGETTVAVPFNSKVKVEAWLDNQPLITSYKIGKGMIVFDGGYSRFYCERFESNQQIFNSILGSMLIK